MPNRTLLTELDRLHLTKKNIGTVTWQSTKNTLNSISEFVVIVNENDCS